MTFQKKIKAILVRLLPQIAHAREAILVRLLYRVGKNPLSASGYAPVASESVVALSVRVALRRRSPVPSVV